MSAPASFVDSSTLVYLYDSRTPKKQAAAQDLFAREVKEAHLHLSTQVFQEFFYAVTKKGVGLEPAAARRAVEVFAEQPLFVLQPRNILAGIDYTATFQINSWDGLILAAAKQAGASILYSKDFTHNQIYEGIRVMNPLK